MDSCQIKNTAVHLPGLNGLRALAALSVVVGHTFQDTFGNWGLPVPQQPQWWIADGVTLFFVISGFLISYLLLQELKHTDSVKVGAFYMRRILRIWPIYYAYILACILVMYLAGNVGDMWQPKLCFYTFFLANIPFLTASGIPLIVHFWSIGVEEQFYLFWPWLVKRYKRSLLPMILVVLFVWLLCKYGSWALWTNKSVVYRFFSVTRFHCMMLGALGAVLYDRRNARFCACMTNKWIQVVVWIIFLASGLWLSYLPAVIRTEVIAVLSLVLVVGQVSGGIVINLENRYCDFVGKISYGIYVIHPLLIFCLSALYRRFQLGTSVLWLQYVGIYSVVIIATLIIATLSYNYFEKPFLRLKDRFSVVQSKSTIHQE